MNSKYKRLCRGLAVAVLVLGIIGSIILAFKYGEVKEVSYSRYYGASGEVKRDVVLTLTILVSSIFGTTVLYAILAGLGEALEYLEGLSEKEEERNASIFEQSKLPPL